MTRQIRYSLTHLLVSMVIAAIASILVFGIWYPYPFREISGGTFLFLVLVSVDIVLGPSLTFVVAQNGKRALPLAIDLVVIAAFQFAALGYGLSTLYEARPVHVVFEKDRLQVVHLVDLADNAAAKTPAQLRVGPFSKPTLLSLRGFRDSKEEFDWTIKSVTGTSLASQPELWQPYEQGRAEVINHSRPVQELINRRKDRAAEIEKIVLSNHRKIAEVMYLPLVGRDKFWTALIDKTSAEPFAYLALDTYD